MADKSTPARNGQIRILVAEDSPTQAEEIKFLLSELGYTVVHARNGREALELARQEPPSLVVSDIVMPEMDGYQLCRAIKHDEVLSKIPVILVTSLSGPADVFKGLDAGADNFIVKPYREDILLSRISYMLTNHELRKSGKLQVGIELELSGQRHFITAERQQILDLLISTYEQAVRFYDELEERQRELTRSYDTLNALYGLAEGLNRCQTVAEVARNAIERGLRLPGVRAGWMYIREGDTFRLVAESGAPASLRDRVMGGPCACQAKLLNNEMKQALNILECQILVGAKDASGLRYHASVPLSVDGEAIGILNLVGSEERMFSDDELRTLAGVGNQIGVALQRARLQEDLERKVVERTGELMAEVAERRQAEDAARMAGEDFRKANEIIAAILDASPVAIVTLDRDLKVVTWNRAAEAIFGHRTGEMVGKPYGFYNGNQSPEGAGYFEAVSSGQLLQGVETRMQRKDGKLIDVIMAGSPLYDEQGNRRGGVFVLEDVTERKQVEVQLRRSQRMESIGNLTGGIAHDFNNLLTIILGNVELLMSTPEGEKPPVSEFADNALRAGLRGAELTRQLLAFSRRQTLEPQVVDINQLAGEALKLLKRTLGGAVEIRFVEGRRTWPVLVDPAQLESAIVNLSVNARDAMPEGGKLTIETSNRTIDETYIAGDDEMKAGDYVVIEVSDTGTGIPPDVLERIFEPFFTTKAVDKGTGLGLAMVYGFVKQSGGHISVYSEVGRGTTFRLYIPRAVDDVKEAAEIAESPAAEVGGETVLVVDDNPGVLMVVKKNLEGFGYNVLTAGDANEALALIEKSGPPDLLFSDIVMPGEMSGVALAIKISKQWPAVKILLTSGFPESAINHRSSEIGFAILSKPYRQAELRQRIRQMLAG